jgi:hypothetical protein
MSKEDAMRAYVRLITTFSPQWQQELARMNAERQVRTRSTDKHCPARINPYSRE